MIYRFIKNLHRTSLVLSFLSFFMAAGISDYNVLELGQQEPAMFGTMIKLGFILLIPTAIYMALNYMIERCKQNVHR